MKKMFNLTGNLQSSNHEMLFLIAHSHQFDGAYEDNTQF